jgi:hypothetical protein
MDMKYNLTQKISIQDNLSYIFSIFLKNHHNNLSDSLIHKLNPSINDKKKNYIIKYIKI